MYTKVLNNWYEKAINGNLKNTFMRHRLLILILFQLFTVIAAYIAAFGIRFDFRIPHDQIEIFYKTLPFLIISRMTAYYYYKITPGSWRYASMRDLMDITKAILAGSVIFLALIALIYRVKDFPRSVFILEMLFSMMLLGGTKFIFRYFHEYRGVKIHYKATKHVLIAGAGKAGVLILNEIRTNPNLGFHVVGFVDDDQYKKGSNIQGVQVLGTTEDIPKLVKKYAVDEIIIVIPSSGYKDIVRILEIARSTNVKTKALPGLGNLILDDHTFVNQLKDVSCEDLLGRKAIKFSRESDFKLLEKEIKGKAVFVTGAGGSIGSELCRQIVQFNPRLLIMYERYENSLYYLEIELRREFPGQKFLPVIGDILNSEKISEILKVNNVDLIYHSAAYKHVPMMEREPLEAVRNNVIGTRIVAKFAIENNVEKFVFISTDKAVNPANIMGLTKRLAELIIHGLNGNSTKFVSVRFGNVIGSNGSVIPLFKKQITEGGPVTVTHPEVTRYFMSIPEAVQLVLIAGSMGKENEIFLLDMGKPIKVVDLAKELIIRSGMEPGSDIDIVFTGLRAGEKLHEELYWQGEGIIPTENKKITMSRPNGADFKNITPKIKLLEEYVVKRDINETMRLLREIVHETKIVNPLFSPLKESLR